MNTVSKGTISFEFVTILVKPHAATNDKGFRLRQIHSQHWKPINQEKIWPICNEGVDSKPLVRGYEYAKRRVVITVAELEAQYHDDYRKRLDKLSESKIPKIAEQPSNVVNLTDAMERSIASIKEQKKPA